MTSIRPLPHIEKTKPYVPGGKLHGSEDRVVMLASNENPFGPSPRAIEAMQDVARQVHVYPDPNYGALRQAIADAKGIKDVSRVAVSAGSDEIIHLLTQAYAGPGDEVLFTEHAFSMYRVSALGHGATPVTVPETDLTAGFNAVLGGVSERTRILFLANPNNPTGTIMEVEDLARLQDALPAHVLFVIDGAYAEYVGETYEAAIRDLVDRRANTVMIRTFSKIYGLAALRLGWGYFPAEIAATFQRIRPPFNINAFAVAAGIASIGDTEFIETSRRHNAEWRAIYVDRLNAMGLPTPKSMANFVIPDFGSPERAAAANEYLKQNNVLVRAVGGYGLPSRLRISIGSAEDNETVLSLLESFTASR
ncbi:MULTISPECIES: histidinol-phosphate transaminase [Hyphomonas]|uniref:Histidinol-phosphate aminotransferase n=1 Tax=Hyphomonas adhaerens TaxID=81029 RepID=A0A3B9GUQ4_9PROT|nr:MULTISPECIES: histidinol-phosphate transaminase [Hyphomonas]MBB40106.1 histidinol-phosphate transaminase [Hyphomonas sp.]HAE26179.1 histidinol-phosphate transaminase [Hyphomonas adhaerens]|tara:strand:- start:174 stop:1265 length:1092 start_codon:yes stop_codon:yes gene_type:complete